MVTQQIVYVSGCFKRDHHERPNFPNILAKLGKIADGNFVTIPTDLFTEMQEGWRDEVKELLADLKTKEKVSCFIRFI